MESVVGDLLSLLEPGEPAEYENLGVVPLFLPGKKGRGPKYLTLAEALGEKLISVTEVSEGGAVPELKVVNRAEKPVLILDGEELVGAKQNRVVNTTILLAAKSATVIPVSCTERGRWSYVSASFRDSGHVMSRKVRACKAAAVSSNLSRGLGFMADQGEVWSEVDELSRKMEVHSPSAAMADVFASRSQSLADYVAAFPLRENQTGLAALTGGRVVGVDFVSRPEAYRVLHPRLVKSYALEAMAEGSSRPGGEKGKDPAALAAEFIRAAAAAEGDRHSSTGLGWDWRLAGDNIVGSALVYRKTVIHTAFFRREEKIYEGGRIHRSRRYRYPVY